MLCYVMFVFVLLYSQVEKHSKHMNYVKGGSNCDAVTLCRLSILVRIVIYLLRFRTGILHGFLLIF